MIQCRKNRSLMNSSHRYFTLEKANQALKLVEPVVSDIVEKRKQALKITNHAKTLKVQNLLTHEEGISERLNEAEKLIDDLEYHLKELESIGCFLRDLDIGLVDFLAIHKGKEVYLCWKPGEKEVRYWHEKKIGSRGRKLIDEAFRKALQPTLFS